MFINLAGGYCREPAAKLLRETAARCTGDFNRERILRAAEEVAAGRPCAFTPEGLTAAEAAKASTVGIDPQTALAPLPHISVWDLFPGIVIRIVQDFEDFDRDKVHAGELLHLVEKSYFAYDGGHTLAFEEKVIRLAEIDPGTEPVIQNECNAYFEPAPDLDSLRRCWQWLHQRWHLYDLTSVEQAAAIRAEIDACGEWLNRPGPRGAPPQCITGALAEMALPNYGPTGGIFPRIAYLFGGMRFCR
ncbi:MAG: hypothetical protein ABIZ80_16130 [Bryobacteraceae bacterium]